MKQASLLLVVLAFAALFGCTGSGEYADGVYQGSAEGYYDVVAVEVTVDGGRISEIRITESQETPAMVEPVNDVLIPEIIEEQGTGDVDTISGATGTSEAVLQAVEAALGNAVTE